ncbi:MAG: glycosyltransferase family 9 protein [Schleiferiaceae bacterium]|nr:glycosyltransferase family 9 protein [Schleiferiaceae bacterium]
MKVLVIRFSSIGDIVLTTPVVRCLNEQLQAEVHFVSKGAFQSFLAPNPHISKAYFFKKDWGEVLPELKAEAYDFVVDLHNNLRSLRLKAALGVPSAAFPKLNIRKWILVNFKLPVMPKVHIVDRYFEAVATLGVANDGRGLDYFIPDADEVSLSFFPKTFENGYLAFVIGGQHAGKMLKAEKIARICAAIDYPIALLGGPEDEQKGETIAQVGSHVTNVAGKFSLNQSASVLRQAKLVVTHDTGLMHIASAFKKDIISLWGGTVPELGMYPYLPGPNSCILERPHIMRPPSKLGKHRGIYKLWDFMEQIPDAVIVAAIQDRIKP